MQASVAARTMAVGILVALALLVTLAAGLFHDPDVAGQSAACHVAGWRFAPTEWACVDGRGRRHAVPTASFEGDRAAFAD